MDNNDTGKNIHPQTNFDIEFATPADYARLYRANGIQVVPACSHSEVRAGAAWKRPLFKSWAEYQHALVPDDLFEQWYGQAGQYALRLNMGVICGNCSNNLFVIDLDTHKTALAEQWWDGLIAIHNNNMELETPTQRTGGGGLQMLFRAPPGWTPPTCKTPIGVDIRGQGGFAMLAPSMHESGRAYEWFDGRSPDDIGITMAPSWLLEAVDALVRDHGGSGATRSANAPAASVAVETAYDGFGHLTDGREELMRDLVWGAVLDWRRDCPIKPGEAESRAKEEEKYLVYEAQVSPRSLVPTLTKSELLEAEGRGRSLFHVKWSRAMRHWDDKVAVEAKLPGNSGKSDHPGIAGNIREYPGNAENEAGAGLNEPFRQAPALLEYLNVRQIKAQPDPVWLIDDLINEAALGFIFGPPGSLKTFMALDMALSITTGRPAWWNRNINSHGAVIYLCREGVASLKFRIQAWEQHRGAGADDAPFYLIRKSLNFMSGDDVRVLLLTVAEIAKVAGTGISAVFVDTVSRVLPGAKENQQEDMSLFIAGCEALQQMFSCVVIGVHHTNKSGGIRGSTVIPGAGDFLIETRREPGAMTGSIVLQKVKDGEDGMEIPFKVTKVELGGIVGKASLMVDPDGAAPAPEAGPGWPDAAVCREILAAIDDHWHRKQPWCHATNSSRSAVTNIALKFNLRRDLVRNILDKWTAEGMIEEVEYNAKTHVKGYRKVFGF